VEQWLGQCANPCVLWSGGKDSTAMLHLIRYEVGAKLPCHAVARAPLPLAATRFSDRLAAEWDLEVYDYAAGLCMLTDGYDIETGQPRFDFVKCYQFGRKVLLSASAPKSPRPKSWPAVATSAGWTL
jgi:hypothetical protein